MKESNPTSEAIHLPTAKPLPEDFLDQIAALKPGNEAIKIGLAEEIPEDDMEKLSALFIRIAGYPLNVKWTIEDEEYALSIERPAKTK